MRNIRSGRRGKRIICLTSSLVWSEVFVNFIGAFFGFGFAIVIEIWVSKKADKDMQEKVEKNIEQELEEIAKKLQDLGAGVTGKLQYVRYYTNVWKACVNSGYLFSVSGKTIYNQYVEIYTKIESANDIEQRYFELKLQQEMSNGTQLIKNALSEMDTRRVEKRKEILNNITHR
jgi:hypothetical protein